MGFARPELPLSARADRLPGSLVSTCTCGVHVNVSPPLPIVVDEPVLFCHDFRKDSAAAPAMAKVLFEEFFRAFVPSVNLSPPGGTSSSSSSGGAGGTEGLTGAMGELRFAPVPLELALLPGTTPPKSP